MSHYGSDNRTCGDLTNYEPSYISDTIHSIDYKDIDDNQADSGVTRIIIYKGDNGQYIDMMDRDDHMTVHTINRVNYDPPKHFAYNK